MEYLERRVREWYEHHDSYRWGIARAGTYVFARMPTCAVGDSISGR